MVYFYRLCKCVCFICGIIWEVNRFVLWFICVLLMKNQLDVVFLYQVSSICFFMFWLYAYVVFNFSKSYCS